MSNIKCQSINKMKLSGNESEMRLLNEKNEKKPINVLAKHGITHDMRIKTKVVSGMLIWAFTFLRGARGEGVLVCFSPFLVYLCSRKKEEKI